MDLFSALNEVSGLDANLLPYDGTLIDAGLVFSAGECREMLKRLLEETAWQRDELVLFGKLITTKREVAWYGNKSFSYAYSGREKVALPWTETLAVIKERVEAISGETFNSCLLNLYHDGTEGMGWHSDDEPELERNATIASVSFGSERRFQFRHRKSGLKVEQTLLNGSLLLMKDEIQQYWQHQLPVSRRVKGLRINLTFRKMRDE